MPQILSIKILIGSDMRIILFGLPGAGKGTLGQKLAQALGVPHLSLGDCVRDTLKKDNPLSWEIRGALSVSQRWQPLNDELAHKVFLEFAARIVLLMGSRATLNS
jgi:adenylate kinase family enzyme